MYIKVRIPDRVVKGAASSMLDNGTSSLVNCISLSSSPDVTAYIHYHFDAN